MLHHRKPRTDLIAFVAALFLTVAWVTVNADAQSATFNFTARVKLEVSADGATAAIVQSYLSRELRKLDGVLVTDEDPDYQLTVIAMETHSQGGYITGYALSSLGLSLWRGSTVEFLLRNGNFTKDQENTLRMFARNGIVVHHLLQTGPTEGLETLCSRLVASFDTNALESSRKMLQQIKGETQMGTTEKP